MPTVFIAGSIKIKKLHSHFVLRISNIVSEKLDVVVGDANGADASIQNELFNQGATNVTVYCTGPTPRNNVGNWTVKQIRSDAEPGTRAFFTAKDIKMAEDADYGLMIWDSASTGTLKNVFALLSGEKKSVIFVNKHHNFIYVKSPTDISNLIDVMSEGARSQAEKKIGLNSLIFNLRHPQTALRV